MLHKTTMQRGRFLVLLGDKPAGPLREATGAFGRGLEHSARPFKRDLRVVTMAGHGHEMPPKYLEMIGAWARGEATAEPDHLPATSDE